MRLGPQDTYWTSSSTFDIGRDRFGTTANITTPTNSTTYINFSFTSLDPTAGLLQFDTLEGDLPYFASTSPGSTTSAGELAAGGNIDFSVIKTAFVRQYESSTFGSMDGYILGPALTLSNLSLTTGGHNTISGALNPTVPASIDLSVNGSAWAPLFDHIAPTTTTAMAGSFYLSVEPYIAADGPNVLDLNPINLISTGASFIADIGPIPGISPTPVFTSISGPCLANQPLTTDVEAGTCNTAIHILQLGDASSAFARALP